ncbi:glycine zipper 2TM domain-containing protein [Pseudolysobacter antarcticus]|uniref:Glycine zipper 2TM domain-containing protein n=2 Tax=Pseudolysobacter antarcticus TaxID=2511995 RepID=A0A411HQ61_9GAMM|nr:glycine zipper 2TM domain-containing protein [Pseudolysobacter antarcticus]
MLALLLLAGVGSAQEQANDGAPAAAEDAVHFGWADVLRVDPVHESARGQGTHEECDEVPVQRSERRSNSGGGTVIGAIVGGVLGHTIGKGDGRRAATVAGAVVGGAVGNGVSRGGDGSYTATETHCIEVPDDSIPDQRIVAYDVEYRYRGEVYMSRVSYDPGDRMRVRVSVLPAE